MTRYTINSAASQGADDQATATASAQGHIGQTAAQPANTSRRRGVVFRSQPLMREFESFPSTSGDHTWSGSVDRGRSASRDRNTRQHGSPRQNRSPQGGRNPRRIRSPRRTRPRNTLGRQQHLPSELGIDAGTRVGTAPLRARAHNAGVFVEADRRAREAGHRSLAQETPRLQHTSRAGEGLTTSMDQTNERVRSRFGFRGHALAPPIPNVGQRHLGTERSPPRQSVRIDERGSEPVETDSVYSVCTDDGLGYTDDYRGRSASQDSYAERPDRSESIPRKGLRFLGRTASWAYLAAKRHAADVKALIAEEYELAKKESRARYRSVSVSTTRSDAVSEWSEYEPHASKKHIRSRSIASGHSAAGHFYSPRPTYEMEEREGNESWKMSMGQSCNTYTPIRTGQRGRRRRSRFPVYCRITSTCSRAPYSARSYPYDDVSDGGYGPHRRGILKQTPPELPPRPGQQPRARSQSRPSESGYFELGDHQPQNDGSGTRDRIHSRSRSYSRRRSYSERRSYSPARSPSRGRSLSRRRNKPRVKTCSVFTTGSNGDERLLYENSYEADERSRAGSPSVLSDIVNWVKYKRGRRSEAERRLALGDSYEATQIRKMMRKFEHDKRRAKSRSKVRDSHFAGHERSYV